MSMIEGVNDRDIQKFEIDDIVISDNQAVGSFNLNTATIILLNINKQYNDLKGAWLDTIFGKLFVHEAPAIQGEITIELKCYDLAYKFDAEYEDVLEFPITVGEWLQAICDTVGVELGSPVFTNSDIVLERRPFIREGGSFRDAVKEIAGSAGGFAQIINNKLYIKWFEDTNNDVLDWFELTQEEETKPVNVVVLGRGDLEDNIMYPPPDEAPVNPHELRIDDNQVLFQREREMIVPIYNQVLGFNYRIFQLRTIGLRTLKAGQRVTYNDIDGMRVSSYVMSHHITFLGGDYNDPNSYESTVSSCQLKETNTNYNYAGTITKRISNTEAQVNKLDKNIALITTDITQIKDEFGNYYTIDESNVLLQNAVDGLTNTFSRAGGNNLINNSSLFFGETNNYDYWTGNLKQTDTDLSVTKKALLLQEGVVVQNIKNLQAGWFSFRFKYKKVGAALDTTLHFTFNDVTYEALGSEGTVELSQDISSGINDIAFITNTSDQYIIYDLMLNYGQEVYLPYQQSQNELRSTQVSISENIKVESNISNTITMVGANGLEGYNKNTNELVFKQTDSGSYSKFMKADSAEISDLMVRKVGNQVWITGMN